MSTNHERIKMLSNLAYSLCKKFEMNPYVVSLYPGRNPFFCRAGFI